MAQPATLPLLPLSISTTTGNNSNLEESDEELFMVPDMDTGEEEETKMINQGSLQSSNGNNNGGEVAPPKRKRGRNPVDKEYRRLKRLLRNRVSAQQARERKKVYVNDLESRANELQEQNFKLEEKISTLVNENTMLRKILQCEASTLAHPSNNGDQQRKSPGVGFFSLILFGAPLTPVIGSIGLTPLLAAVYVGVLQNIFS
uniref:ADP,ATP carrier protein n=1 Tax=Chenopodium quinoa TaxID=63459 RepID=A0A803M5E9_CHEQI